MTNPDNPITTHEHRTLARPVNAEEFVQRAEQLEIELQKRDDLEQEKKRWLKEWNGHFATNALEIKKLRKAVSTRTEDQTIRCLVTYDETENKAVVTDPEGTVVEERAMTAEDREFCQNERQGSLPVDGKSAGAGDDAGE